MIANLAYTANPLEWTITLVGVFTLAVCIRIFSHFYRLRKSWRRSGENGLVGIAANGNVEVGAINMVIQLVMVGMGLFYMFTPPVNPRAPITTGGLVLAFGLIFIELTLAVKMLRMYRRLVRMIRYEPAEPLKLLAGIPGWDAQNEAIDGVLVALVKQQEANQEGIAATLRIMAALKHARPGQHGEIEPQHQEEEQADGD